MKVKFSFVCDYAAHDAAGKLNVIGIFESIAAPKFPHNHPIFTYVAKLKFENSEVGKHQFIAQFIDSDNNEIVPKCNGEFIIPKGIYHNIIMCLNNVQFPKPKKYMVNLIVDGVKVATDTINVTTS